MVHLGDTASFLRVVRIYAKKGEGDCYPEEGRGRGDWSSQAWWEDQEGGRQDGPGHGLVRNRARFPLPLGRFVQVTLQGTPPAQLYAVALGKLDHEPK